MALSDGTNGMTWHERQFLKQAPYRDARYAAILAMVLRHCELSTLRWSAQGHVEHREASGT
jgi:hypothetical protein